MVTEPRRRRRHIRRKWGGSLCYLLYSLVYMLARWRFGSDVLLITAYGHESDESDSSPASLPSFSGLRALPQIPRVVHQTWKSRKMPRCLEVIRQSWIKTNPGWEIRLWDDEQIDKFCSNHLSPKAAERYRELSGVQRSDVWRILCLYELGGVYADVDLESLRPLDHLFNQTQHKQGVTMDINNSILILSPEPRAHCKFLFGAKVLCNAFMVASKGHRILEELRKIVLLVLETKDRMQNLDRGVFGPLLLNRIVNSNNFNNTIVLDSKLIYPVVDILNIRLPESKRRRSYKIIRRKKYRQAYTVHYWFHTDWNLKGNISTCRDFLIHRFQQKILFR
ncbi:hypothetical protein AAMO2058_001135800 [Amorphochlora amoebiformis]